DEQPAGPHEAQPQGERLRRTKRRGGVQPPLREPTTSRRNRTMKEGKSLAEVAATIRDQAARKEDFVVDTRDLVMLGGTELHLSNGEDYIIDHIAHRQIGDRLGIPSKYYDRLREPDRKLDEDAQAELRRLLDTNVNTLFR